MDNLELRQRITRSMIRVAERTQKGTHFPAVKAKDQRPCSLLAKVARGGGQTAEAGRSLISG